MKPVLIVVAAMVFGAVLGALTTSRVYWGYWLRVPSADWLVADVASTERFTVFACCDRPSESGHTALQTVAGVPMQAAGDAPVANLPAAIIRRGVPPTSDLAVPATVLSSVREALDAAGVLVAGEPQYQYAKTIWGNVAIGRTKAGGELVLAAVWAGEVSNDHHPYYEAKFARTDTGQLTLLGARRYWWDFAGVEGIAHWLGGVAGAIAGVACSLAFLLLRTAGRRRLRNTVDSPGQRRPVGPA